MNKDELVSIAKEYSSLEIAEPNNTEKLQALESNLYDGMSEMSLDDMYAFVNEVRDISIRVNGQEPDNFMHGYGEINRVASYIFLDKMNQELSYDPDSTSLKDKISKNMDDVISNLKKEQVEQVQDAANNYTPPERDKESLAFRKLEYASTWTVEQAQDKLTYRIDTITAEDKVWNDYLNNNGRNPDIFYTGGKFDPNDISCKFDLEKYEVYQTAMDFRKGNVKEYNRLQEDGLWPEIDSDMSPEEIEDAIWDNFQNNGGPNPDIFYTGGVYKAHDPNCKFSMERYEMYMAALNDPSEVMGPDEYTKADMDGMEGPTS